MHAVFKEVRGENEITVFCVGYVVYIFAVDEIAAVCEVEHRNFEEKLVPLFEKGAVKVGFDAVFEWIPFVSPPTVVAIDSEGRVLGEECDYWVVAEFTSVPI